MPARKQHPAIVFFDLDGTLVNKQNMVPATAMAAIRQLRQNGHLAFLNTGRSLAGIHPHILEVTFDGIVAACGTYIEYQGETLLNRLIDPAILDTVLPVLERSAIDVWMEGPEHVYFQSLPPHANVARFFRLFEDLPGVNQDWHDSLITANKLCYLLRPDSIPEPGLTMLRQHFHIINHEPDPFGEAVQLGFSKATGMQFVLDHLNIDQRQTYAFGDSLNDIEMLTFARCGIAMGGSRSHVLQASDHVTGGVDNNGIADALQRFGLI